MVVEQCAQGEVCLKFSFKGLFFSKTPIQRKSVLGGEVIKDLYSLSPPPFTNLHAFCCSRHSEHFWIPVIGLAL